MKIKCLLILILMATISSIVFLSSNAYATEIIEVDSFEVEGVSLDFTDPADVDRFRPLMGDFPSQDDVYDGLWHITEEPGGMVGWFDEDEVLDRSIPKKQFSKHLTYWK